MEKVKINKAGNPPTIEAPEMAQRIIKHLLTLLFTSVKIETLCGFYKNNR